MMTREKLERKVELLETMACVESADPDFAGWVDYKIADLCTESGVALERLLHALKVWCLLHPELAVNVALGVEREVSQAIERRQNRLKEGGGLF